MAIGLKLNPGNPPYGVVEQQTRIGPLFTIFSEPFHFGAPFLTHETARVTNGYKVVVDEILQQNAKLYAHVAGFGGSYIAVADQTSFEFRVEIYEKSGDIGNGLRPNTLLISFTELNSGVGQHGGAQLSSCDPATSAHQHALQTASIFGR